MRIVPITLSAALLTGACGGAPKHPMVTGGEVYAQVAALKSTGSITIRDATVGKNNVLSTGPDGQQFIVWQVIEHCKGGDPIQDVDCTLALLISQKFAVLDKYPTPRTHKTDDEDDESSSAVTAAVIVGGGAAAEVGLIYGAFACEFEGCQAVFGVPAALVGGLMLFALAGML